MSSKKVLTKTESSCLIAILKERFEKNKNRHKNITWNDVVVKLEANPGKIWSLNEMEKTGGEPDVVGKDTETGEYLFYDCSTESPSGRRSYCYDREALNKRKEHKPKNSVQDVAKEIGISILNEEEYRTLQTLGKFDTKTSSWLQTPNAIRTLGGAIFGDYRYGTVFIYHNGADSYYAARGFRGCLKI